MNVTIDTAKFILINKTVSYNQPEYMNFIEIIWNGRD